MDRHLLFLPCARNVRKAVVATMDEMAMGHERLAAHTQRSFAGMARYAASYPQGQAPFVVPDQPGVGQIEMRLSVGTTRLFGRAAV
jgi:hypothetical protein